MASDRGADGHGAIRKSAEDLRDLRLDLAVNGLKRRMPEFSSGTLEPARSALILALWLALIASAAVAVDVPAPLTMAVSLAVSSLIVMIVLLRVAGLCHLLWPRPSPGDSSSNAPSAREANGVLPFYSILVPVYDEAECAPGLVAALAALDYPQDRIEILIITEFDDAKTRQAFRNHLPTGGAMRIVVVPAGLPRTKPRALNYALLEARGDLVAVYDAEDAPAPDQLRKAAAAFANAGPLTACYQARLDVRNASQSQTSRQFALEYGALFHGVLPALDRLGLPLPLGGTSNHFRRDILERVGGWDPFNVTEDADLGMRLARAGYRVAMLDSSTSEEAPATWRVWLKQRMRWLKGWLQTYMVHMRDPRRLWRELGAWQFLGFQLMLGGMMLSALMHPWFLLFAGHGALSGQPLLAAGDGALYWLCAFNLIVGYTVGIALTAVAAIRIGKPKLAFSALWLPLYWLAISFAAYAAAIELVRRPYHWHKTPHSARLVPQTTKPGI